MSSMPTLPAAARYPNTAFIRPIVPALKNKNIVLLLYFENRTSVRPQVQIQMYYIAEFQ